MLQRKHLIDVADNTSKFDSSDAVTGTAELSSGAFTRHSMTESGATSR